MGKYFFLTFYVGQLKLVLGKSVEIYITEQAFLRPFHHHIQIKRKLFSRDKECGFIDPLADKLLLLVYRLQKAYHLV